MARRSSTDTETALWQLKAKFETQEYQQESGRPHDQRDARAPEEKPVVQGGAGLAVDGSGFCLDPSYDYEALGRGFQRYRTMIPSSLWPDADLDHIFREIQAKREGPLLDLLYSIEQAGGEQKSLIRGLSTGLLHSAQFQHARYDGALKGTEVGMALFYTDLMAKVWALD